MTRYVLKAWQIDITDRTTGIDQLPGAGRRVKVHEILPGVIYRDANIKVIAFPARHGDLAAFGFRFETSDRVVVISGDTAPTSTVAQHCENCDVLIHEAYSLHTYRRVSRKWQRYRRTHHTSAVELAELANRVRPRMLLLYHRSNAGAAETVQDSEDQLLQEMRELYCGPIACAHDLEVF
jgi:ribonuclease BN (tRNA processing enzyme)